MTFKDIIIFSPVISQGVDNNSTTIGFLRSTSNLFNVALTRAKSILWIVGDKKKCVNSNITYLRNFVEYVEEEKYKDIDLPYGDFQSPWEKKFFEALVGEGFDPKAQYRSGPYFIDMVLFNDDKKIAIEVDGEQWHTDMTGERLERDIIRDRNLINMGWDVNRFWVHDLKYDMSKYTLLSGPCIISCTISSSCGYLFFMLLYLLTSSLGLLAISTFFWL